MDGSLHTVIMNMYYTIKYFLVFKHTVIMKDKVNRRSHPKLAEYVSVVISQVTIMWQSNGLVQSYFYLIHHTNTSTVGVVLSW